MVVWMVPILIRANFIFVRLGRFIAWVIQQTQAYLVARIDLIMAGINLFVDVVCIEIAYF